MPVVDEELTEAGPWWSATDGRRSIVVISCLVLLVVAVGWIVADQRGSRGTSSPSAVSETDANITPIRIDFDSIHRCPADIVCTTDESVPSATSAAIAQYLPGGYERRTVTVTEVKSHRLRFRAVNATVGPVELLVIVSVPDASRPATMRSADPRPGAAIRYARRQEGTFEIQVQFTGPPGGVPAAQLAFRLAADPRLLVMD